jgi:hypothetical protein
MGVVVLYGSQQSCVSVLNQIRGPLAFVATTGTPSNWLSMTALGMPSIIDVRRKTS